MTPERWKKIDELVQAALELKAEERPAFLDSECRGDAELRREVESLVACQKDASGFLASPAIKEAAELMGDAESLEGRTVSHYHLRRKIGEGGMGAVYLARDRSLDREVAIKFISPDSAQDELSRKRLLREARAAARLDHPNICSIYEVGEEGGLNFIVMQYVEGQTLASLILRGPIGLKESLDIAVQIADALAEAHSHGIIHRDVKPQNIMITARNQAKVMDFGLAKVIRDRSSAESEVVTESLLTEPRAIVGTIPYMSPEQVQGEILDTRSDIFSFGAVLYETISGHKPFEAENAAALISAILSREPMPLARYTVNVPTELERIARKCLEKDRERRYQTMRDVAIDLENLRSEHASARVTAPDLQNLQRDAVMAQTATSEKAITQPRIPGRRPTVVMVALAVGLLAAVGFGLYWFAGGHPATINSIAVLPFVNASIDPDTEYLSDGLTENLINSLSQLPNLKVISFSSVMHYKGQQIDPEAAGRALRVRAVLMGRIVKRGDGLSISAELVDVQDKSHLWGTQYERKLSDLIGLKGEIAKDVSSELRLRLSGEEQKRLTKPYTDNIEAYQLYLKGLYYSARQNEEEVRKGIEYLNQAIKVDPNYALAYAGLSSAYYHLSYSYLPPREAMPKAKAAAMRALALDNMLAEAHTSIAIVKTFYEWDWSGAEAEYQQAIGLNRNYAPAHQWYGWHLALVGQPDKSISELERAQEIDPLSSDVSWSLGVSLFFARRYDEAIKQLQKTLEQDPNMPLAHFHLAASYEQQGKSKEAIAEFRKATGAAPDASLGHAYAAFGKRDEALKILDTLKERSARGDLPGYEMAILYTGLGDKDRAFEWLVKAYEDRSELMSWLKVDPRLDNLRSDERFTKLMRRVGLSP